MSKTFEQQNGAAANLPPGFSKLYGTKKDFASLMGVSLRTVNTWLSRGMPGLKTSARQVRLNLIECAAWAESEFRVVRLSGGSR
jgi:hypothetical protein